MDLPKLPKRFQKTVLDVCGVKRPKDEEKVDVHVTHLHGDHILSPKEFLRKNVVFRVPSDPKISNSLRTLYKGKAEIEDYGDVLEPVEHTFRNPKTGKIDRTQTYPYVIGEVLVVPECDKPEKVLEGHKTRVNIISAFEHEKVRGRGNWMYTEPFENQSMNVDYIIKNKTWFWENQEDNVIPKVLCSLYDRKYLVKARSFDNQNKRQT